MGEYRDASARYLASIVSSLKENRSRSEHLENEREKWKNRIELAQKKNRSDLEEGARRRLEEVEEKLSAARKEEVELKTEAEKIRGELRGVMPDDGSGVDAEALAAYLDGLTSESDPSHSAISSSDSNEKDFDRLSVEEELKRLKNEIEDS